MTRPATRPPCGSLLPRLSLALLAVFWLPPAASPADWFPLEVRQTFFEQAVGEDGAKYYRSRHPAGARSRFAAEKSSGAVRIFILGGAVTRAYDPAAGGVFRSLLKGKEIEIINCAAPGHDSARTALLAGELLDYDPDLLVVMSGHSERPGGVSTLWRHRVAEGLQVDPIAELVRSITGGRPGPKELAKRRALRLANELEANLRHLVRRARSRDVPVVLCTLPINLRDSAPRGPMPLSAKGFFNAWTKIEERDWKSAVSRLRALLYSDPGSAFGHYLLAEALAKDGRPRRSKRHLLKAADLEPPGGRTRPAHNDAIRRLARKEGAILADLDALFRKMVPDGVPDSRVMLDWGHWIPELHPEVTRAWLEAVKEHNLRKDAAVLARPEDWSGKSLEPVSPPPADGDARCRAVWRSLSAGPWTPRPYWEDPAVFSEDGVSSFVAAWESCPELRKRLAKEKPGPAVLAHAAEACRRLGLHEEALELFDRAVALDPAQKLLLLYRGVSRWRSGDKTGAREDFDGLRGMEPKHPEIRYYREHLGLER